jgi:hypothetical protein
MMLMTAVTSPGARRSSLPLLPSKSSPIFSEKTNDHFTFLLYPYPSMYCGLQQLIIKGTPD